MADASQAAANPQTGVELLQQMLADLIKNNPPQTQMPNQAPVIGDPANNKTPAASSPAASATPQAAAASTPNNGTIASPADMVMRAILNQGQLIQTPLNQGSGNNNNMNAELLNAINQLSGKSSSSSQSSSSKSSAGGIVGALGSLASIASFFL